MRIAIIDIIGIPYDGTTVYKQGLGGSESAVTYMSEELASLGFDVTVFNNCTDHASPGVYNGVKYLLLDELNKDYEFDIVISSRTVIPFARPEDYHKLGDNRAMAYQHMNLYNRILSHARMRVLWMHDTFCLGDNLIEELAVENRITDIFTLSDFHLTYVANCNHGRRRMFEVLKPKLFITRNGAKRYVEHVDIAAKDPNLFVYNASVTKGMVPLVNEIWPIVKQNIPDARLKVIGGYYRVSATADPDQQEIDWRRMVADPGYSQMGIEFVGVIPQKQIAEILSAANFMIYPCDFPETFGISTLESLLYNTPVITCRFGALEEIAVDNASYKIDYPIVPNGLFSEVNRAEQVQKFAAMTVQAYRDPYLHQQKQYYCNSIKNIAGWDSVALQWKQWFYKKTGNYLSRDEYRTVSKINRQVHKIWGRRYHNTIEFEGYKAGNEQPIVVVSTFYNCANYIARCIKSISVQDYDNYQVYLINDASTDNTQAVVYSALSQLPDNIRGKFHVIDNKTNIGAVANQVSVFRAIEESDAIVMILDGDDSLVNDNTIFSYYNAIYDGTTEFTYGSCWSMVDNIPLISQPYPEHIKQRRAYRQHRFNWNMPYTHLRTFRKYLIDGIPDTNFQDETGRWFGAGGDGSTFYSLIEAADPDQVKCLQEVVYNYNDVNPLNDYKVNSIEQTRNATKILNNNMNTAKKKILIAIPTAKNIEPDTFKSIYDLVVPDGYETTFQFFYGYNIDQVRNLIADWVVKGFDYLFSVDSDIAFPPDTLARLISHNKDMVSGLYIQRKPGEHILEVYEHNGRGGVVNIPYGKIAGMGLVEIASCGFGCVLVKGEVLRAIDYPHFVYHSAIDHVNTISEDVDFCRKALNKGFKIWADTNIKCQHIGSTTFTVDNFKIATTPKEDPVLARLRQIASENHIPSEHVNYVQRLELQPKVVYDIGANVLEWTRLAKNKWPGAEVVAFEAMEEIEPLCLGTVDKYYLGVLSDQDDKVVKFYQNSMVPWGNSYYLENEQLSLGGKAFDETNAIKKISTTLDTIVAQREYPLPDFMKLDVQGAELDVLKGAQRCLANCTDLILELQHTEYNIGAPLKDEVVAYLDSIGFEQVACIFAREYDGDYHFKKKDRLPARAYILRTTDARSMEYASLCAQSCHGVQMPYEYVNGYEGLSQDNLWHRLPLNITVRHAMKDSAACATASHLMIWKKIVERKETAVILEHDAIMLHPVTLPIPDNQIVALGYKYENAHDYDHQGAGAPTEIESIRRHSGAHAYAITWRTAERLLEEVERRGILNAVDNFYFMRINDPGDTETEMPLSIMLPTPAICWLRESTIWPGGPSTLNYDVRPEFLEYFR
jgi:FkbM family methyltransferase